MRNIELSIVVAMTPSWVIGTSGTIPWRIPSDLRRFKRITMAFGNVIVGRKTWESIPQTYRPLPNRHSIIVSRGGYVPTESGSLEVVTSVEEALMSVRARGGRAGVIGGEEIYRLFLPLTRTIHVTMVYANVVGDAHFPQVDRNEWEGVSGERNLKEAGDEYRTSFLTYRRKQK